MRRVGTQLTYEICVVGALYYPQSPARGTAGTVL